MWAAAAKRHAAGTTGGGPDFTQMLPLWAAVTSALTSRARTEHVIATYGAYMGMDTTKGAAKLAGRGAGPRALLTQGGVSPCQMNTRRVGARLQAAT